VYKDHVVSAIAKFEDDIVNEVEMKALITSILCTIEKQKNLTGYYRNRGNAIEEWILSAV
jgi:hypothetical protein